MAVVVNDDLCNIKPIVNCRRCGRHHLAKFNSRRCERRPLHFAKGHRCENSRCCERWPLNFNANLAFKVAKRTTLVIFLKPIINYVFFIQNTLFTSKTPKLQYQACLIQEGFLGRKTIEEKLFRKCKNVIKCSY